jgi:hypothetical protein
MTAKELFADWQDPDFAEYYLACLLGVMDFDPTWDTFRKNKGVFSTGNKVGDALFDMLEQMVTAGMLEKNDDLQYRWNASFKGYWEGGTEGLS